MLSISLVAIFISSSVVFLEKENLIEDLASLGDIPMLRSILEISKDPEEHAEPVDATICFISSIVSRSSAKMSKKAMLDI